MKFLTCFAMTMFALAATVAAANPEIKTGTLADRQTNTAPRGPAREIMMTVKDDEYTYVAEYDAQGYSKVKIETMVINDPVQFYFEERGTFEIMYIVVDGKKFKLIVQKKTRTPK